MQSLPPPPAPRWQINKTAAAGAADLLGGDPSSVELNRKLGSHTWSISVRLDTIYYSTLIEDTFFVRFCPLKPKSYLSFLCQWIYWAKKQHICNHGNIWNATAQTALLTVRFWKDPSCDIQDMQQNTEARHQCGTRSSKRKGTGSHLWDGGCSRDRYLCRQMALGHQSALSTSCCISEGNAAGWRCSVTTRVEDV